MLEKASPTARRIAKTILNGFDSYFADFQNITLVAKARFEAADWHSALSSNTRRLDLYKLKSQEILELVQDVTSKNTSNLELWREVKSAYASLVSGHTNYEIAETFFNSIFCAKFDHLYINDDNLFVFPSRPIEEKPAPDYSISISYQTEKDDLVELTGQILDDFEFSTPWENKRRDVANIVRAFQQEILPRLDCPLKDLKIDMLESVFYRNKAAYLVGRVSHANGNFPIILPCRHNEENGIFVDTAIFNEDEASVIFSFTRSYFMVDAPIPSRFVRFLRTLMPNKTLAELYNSIGFNKHGKTEFNRSLINHMNASDDQFIIAPGIKGMVMTVFTLPSYDQVFKIIKDKFDPPKTVTEQIVKDKYKLVSRSDRAGRMADTQEYSNFIFDKNRFSDELLEELNKAAPSKLVIDGDQIIIKHLYVERRMKPLNIFLHHADQQQICDAMDEYGNSIKQLASANIFPGDMLLKNFGVTRHGRVVFYDYDEICLLTDCNFRKIPEPRNEMEEMADRPWYKVAENDIFPEEFKLFFSGNPAAKKAFEELHGDLYDYQYWQSLQQAINDGHVSDAFPYRRNKRFRRSL